MSSAISRKFPAIAIAAISLFAGFACESTRSGERSVSAGSVRIVSVGGPVTEIVYALGAEDKLVGTDTSSLYPDAATKLPQVGYQRQLSAEGVLSLKPSLLIVPPEAGPPAVIEQIASTGVQIVRVTNESSVEGAKTKIREIAEALDLRQRGEELITQLDGDVIQAQKFAASKTTRPKVVFLYSRGSGAPQVGGSGTPAESMITMAGGVNAITGFSQYRPLTPEALVAAQPDVILVPSRGIGSMGGVEGVLNLPGVADTPAGKNKKVVAIDDMLLLGFTPRLGEGIKELCEKIH